MRIETEELLRITLKSGATVEQWTNGWRAANEGNRLDELTFNIRGDEPRIVYLDTRTVAAFQIVAKRRRLRFGL